MKSAQETIHRSQLQCERFKLGDRSTKSHKPPMKAANYLNKVVPMVALILTFFYGVETVSLEFDYATTFINFTVFLDKTYAVDYR